MKNLDLKKILLFSCVLTLFSFEVTNSLEFNTKESFIVSKKNHLKEIENSLLKINESLYASKLETSNELYNIFLEDLVKANDSISLRISSIDSMNWTKKENYNPAYSIHYHRHISYNEYPVVNISYEAANLFCSWLSNRYNSFSNRKFNKVIFRLPSRNEWEMCAKGDETNSIYFHSEKLNKKFEQSISDVTYPVESFQNKFGISNLIGNVSEMVLEKKIVKGGGWKTKLTSNKIEENTISDGTANPQIGFRFFMEIL